MTSFGPTRQPQRDMTKLSEQDRKLLYFLQLNARASVPALAKLLDESEHAARRRLSRISHSLRLRTMPILNLSLLGYSRYEVLFNSSKSILKKKSQLYEAIVQHPNTLFLGEIGGDYQAMISVMASSFSELDAYLRSFSNRFKGAFAERELLPVLGHSLLGTQALAPGTKRQAPIEWFESDKRVEIDQASGKILFNFCNRSVRSIAELARQVKMPAATVEYRLKQMEKSGLIKGYFDAFDPVDLGMFPFNIFFSFRSITDEIDRRFRKLANETPEVDMVIQYAGRWNFALLCFVRGARDVRPLVDTFNQHFGAEIGTISVMPQFTTYAWTEYNIKPA